MSEKRRVVITGCGALSPLGPDVGALWNGLVEGRSGVGMITRFDATEFTTKIAAEVKTFDALVQEMEENTKGKSSLSWFQSSATAYVQASKEMMRHMKEGKKFSRMEQQWIARGSGWMVKGSYEAVLKKFNDLIDKSNSVRF